MVYNYQEHKKEEDIAVDFDTISPGWGEEGLEKVKCQEATVSQILPMNGKRLGKPNINKPRPMRISFSSQDAKHMFLKYSKDFRKVGIRLDDDLTRLQQQERSNLLRTYKF